MAGTHLVGEATVSVRPELPFLAPPPRTVPWLIQWRLFRGAAVCAVGIVFVGMSSLFLILFWTNADGPFSWWQVFTMLHLGIGLGLAIAPVAVWRRKVAILREGQLAHACIVAVQDRSGNNARGDVSMVNTTGSWLDYQRAFDEARAFWTTRLQTPPGLRAVSIFFKCVVAFFGMFGAAWTILVAALIWFGDNELSPDERVSATLALLGITTVFFGFLWFFGHFIGRLRRFADGNITPGTLGVEPACTCRFVFHTSDGKATESTAKLDLRSRLEKDQAEPDDIAIYLPDDPRRAILLGGLWPPLAILDGELSCGEGPN